MLYLIDNNSVTIINAIFYDDIAKLHSGSFQLYHNYKLISNFVGKDDWSDAHTRDIILENRMESGGTEWGWDK